MSQLVSSPVSTTRDLKWFQPSNLSPVQTRCGLSANAPQTLLPTTGTGCCARAVYFLPATRLSKFSRHRPETPARPYHPNLAVAWLPPLLHTPANTSLQDLANHFAEPSQPIQPSFPFVPEEQSEDPDLVHSSVHTSAAAPKFRWATCRPAVFAQEHVHACSMPACMNRVSADSHPLNYPRWAFM